jgi:two-component sensor histidine kinase
MTMRLYPHFFSTKTNLFVAFSLLVSALMAQDRPVLNLQVGKTYRIEARSSYESHSASLGITPDFSIPTIARLNWSLEVIEKTPKDQHLVKVRCTRALQHEHNLNDGIDSDYLSEADQKHAKYESFSKLAEGTIYWQIDQNGRITHCFDQNPKEQRIDPKTAICKDSIWLFAYFIPDFSSKNQYFVDWTEIKNDFGYLIPLTNYEQNSEHVNLIYGDTVPREWLKTKLFVRPKRHYQFNYVPCYSVGKIQLASQYGRFRTSTDTLNFDPSSGWIKNGQWSFWIKKGWFRNPDLFMKPSPKMEKWLEQLVAFDIKYLSTTRDFNHLLRQQEIDFQEKIKAISSDRKELSEYEFQVISSLLRYRRATILLSSVLMNSQLDLQSISKPLKEYALDLPLVNDLVEDQYIFPFFLQNILDYKMAYLPSGHRYHRSFRLAERYNMAGLLFTGKSRFVLQKSLLEQAMGDNISLHHILPIFENFRRQYPQAPEMVNLQTWIERLKKLEPGNPFPYFQAKTQEGIWRNINDYRGQKILLHIIDHIHFLKPNVMEIDLWKLKKYYPEFKVIHLAFIYDNTTLDKIIKAKMNPDAGELLIIRNDMEGDLQRWKEALNHLNISGQNNRTYLIDEKGKIFDYLLFADQGSIIFNEEFAQKVPAFIAHKAKNEFPWLKKWGLPTLGLLLSLILGTWIGSALVKRKEKARRERLENQLQLIRTQLNPHFVFNTMNAIQQLILSQKNQQASEYLSELGGLMRKVLSLTKNELISLYEEMELLGQYCKLEALRKNFDWKISLPPELDLHNTLIPSMLLQPLVENSILHGFLPMQEKGQLDIMVETHQNQLYVRILDNGLGLAKAQKNESKGLQKSMAINRERLRLLYQNLARLELKPRSAQNGTEALVVLPLDN